MGADRVRRVLSESGKPLSTNEIANQAGVDWHTAHKHLTRLVERDEAFRSELSNRLTLYWDQKIPF